MKRILLLLLIVPAIVFAQQEKHSRVSINFDEERITKLYSLGLPLDHALITKTGVVAELSQSEITLLQNNNFLFSIIIDDLTKHYELGLSNTSTPDNSGFLDCNTLFNDTITTPQNFSLGTMGGFFKYAEMLAHLDSMVAKFPNLITIKKQIGAFTTFESRPIYYVKISDNPNNDESALESQVLYDAVHHAREPMSMAQLIFYMYYLLENYGVNAQVTHIVNNLELFFVPCVNPDGYIYNETTNPNGGGFWRKNRFNNGDGTFGIDLNRNYGYNWGLNNIGSSPNTSSNVYRGPSPFSEPETQAMKFLCENHEFKLSLNYHSYSNLLLLPEEYVEDSIRYLRFAETITYNNHYTHGTGVGTLGYSVNGDSDAWMYKEQTTKDKQYSFTPEVGNNADGFWPQQSRIIPLAQENMLANINMALLASNYVGINEVSDYYVSSTDNLDIELDNYGIELPSSAVVSATTTSPSIGFVGIPVTVNNFTDLGIKSLSIPIKMVGGALEGAQIDFDIEVDFGTVKLHKTITKVFSTQQPSLSEHFDINLVNWDLDFWGATDEHYYTSPYSITDSPYSDYLANLDNELVYKKNVDLTNPNVKEAYMNFNARWDTENGYDYVQLIINDGTTDYPMCGNYTNLGVGFTGQPDGEPLYDGFQNDWVNESIDLSNFLGQIITIKFVMVSDGGVEEDGFYLDDFKIYLVEERENNLKTKLITDVSVFPNPANDRILIKAVNTEGVTLSVFNILGEKIEVSYTLQNNYIIANVSQLNAGLYYVSLTQNGNIVGRTNFVKK